MKQKPPSLKPATAAIPPTVAKPSKPAGLPLSGVRSTPDPSSGVARLRELERGKNG